MAQELFLRLLLWQGRLFIQHHFLHPLNLKSFFDALGVGVESSGHPGDDALNLEAFRYAFIQRLFGQNGTAG